LNKPRNVVGRALPFHCTTELDTKPEPPTNKLKVGPPTGAQLGSRRAIVGMGFVVPPLIVKFNAFEVPPPGGGLVTVTIAAPAETMAAAGIAAVSWVELMNVVVADVAPKLTIEAATKFAPLTVSVKAAPPAMALFGETEVTAGVGLVGLGWLVIVEAVPPPHPVRHKRTPIPRIAGPFISILREVFSPMMPSIPSAI
jgi:hypothetical protein